GFADAAPAERVLDPVRRVYSRSFGSGTVLRYYGITLHLTER
ncbi:MAG: hypothetical protein ACI8WY_002072, partial [Planctomycetota bacterium]